MAGPFDTLTEVAEAIRDKPHLSHRFPLPQKGKARPIDNLKDSGINSAFGSHDKLVLHDCDTLAAVVRLVEKVLHFKHVPVALRSGSVVQFEVHDAWKTAGPWAGKTADLKAAYKQFCLHPSQFWAAVVCASNPVEQKTALMPQFTLPLVQLAQCCILTASLGCCGM